MKRYLPAALALIGLGFLTVAAFALHPIAGIAAVGADCILVGLALNR